jgi:hypothetical protein
VTEARACSRLLAGIALAVAAADVRAQGTTTVVAQFLVMAALFGGALSGAWAGIRGPKAIRLWPAFLVYLGLLSMVASTWAGSLEIVPLTLLFGAIAGIAPFAASFFLLRHLVLWIRDRLRSRAVTKS